MHAAALLRAKVPATQAEHDPALTPENEPGPHPTHEVAPDEEYVPAMQSVQEAALATE